MKYNWNRSGNVDTNLNFATVKRSMTNWKSINYPKKPNSIEEIQRVFCDPNIIEKYGSTHNGEAFYIDTIIARDYKFTIFASPNTIEFIEKNIAPESSRYLMDGTFDSLPKGYKQLLIISIEFQNDVSRLLQTTC